MTPRFVALTVALLAVQAGLAIGSIRREAQTWDEGIYLAAGLSYWKTGDFRMNPEHPPLAKLLCAAPLLAMNVRLPLESPFWKNADETNFGAVFLYTNRLSADDLLFPARCVTIALMALLGLSVALWSHARFGATATLAALSMYAFDPNIVAHGRYATNDLAVALFSFLTCIAWGHPVLCGLALGLALASKFSAIYLLPVLALFWWIWRPAWRSALVIAGMALAVLTLLYAGHPGVFIEGLRLQLDHNAHGHESYLFGRISQTGWWYYFPAVLALKWPGAILAMLAVTGAYVAWKRPRPTREVLRMAIPIAVFFALCLQARIDIGVRYLLPLFPPLYILIAVALVSYAPRWFTAAALLALAVESFAIYPDYLAFFNVFAGGPANGPRYLLDSNIDWGQDTKKLKTWLDARGVQKVCRVYFGNAILAHYGIEEAPLPSADDPSAIRDLDCIAAASVTPLYGLYAPGDPYRWLRAHQPLARIGYSIYVYDLRKKR